MSIHYIVATYLGNHGSILVNTLLQSDRHHFIKRHLECLSKYKVDDITKVSFIVNEHKKNDDLEILKIAQECSLQIPIEVVFRENTGYSYAAWNKGVTDSIKNNEPFDYYFLIEDDYLPNRDYFYQPFIDAVKENTAFVSQVWRTNHAAMSNGLLVGKCAEKILEKYPSVFNVKTENTSYYTAIYNQVNFLSYAKDLGMNFTDVCDTSLQVYLNNNEFQFWGNPEEDVLIVPESCVSWNELDKERYCRNIEEKDEFHKLVFREKDENTIELITEKICKTQV
jgi:hypothetical protein